MNCRRSQRALRQRLDETLQLDLELRLQSHLADCARCRAFDARAQALEEALVRLPEPPVERLDVERALQAVRVARVARVPATTVARPWRRVAAVVVGSAAASFALWIALSEDTRSREQLADSERVTPTEVTPAPEPPTLVEAELSPLAPVEASTSQLAPEQVLDVERLAAARTEVRERLSVLGASLELDATPEEVEAFAQLFELDTLALRRGDWPVRRIVEGSLSLDDLAVASAAARYLGARGDSSSLRHLRAALQREELAPVAVRAMIDLGPTGVESLGLALTVPEARDMAIIGLVRMGNRPAAEQLARGYEASLNGESGADAELLDALAQLGTPALPELLALHAQGSLDQYGYHAALENIDGAEAWFTERLEAGDLEHPRSTLDGIGTLAPGVALSWLEGNLHERRYRELTRELLPIVPGSATVACLARLHADSRLSSADLADMTTRALLFDAARFVTAASEHGPGSVNTRETFLELALAIDDERAVMPVLLVSVADAELAESARAEAALRIGVSDNSDALPVLQEVFAMCTSSERQLAAACLIGIARIGGDDALNVVLDGGPRRPNKNIRSLLQRREAGERISPSIYKLARELKPFLSARDQANRRTSS